MPKNALIVDDSAPLRTTILRGATAATDIAGILAMGNRLADTVAANAGADLVLEDVRLPDPSRSGFVEAVRNSVAK